MGINIGICFAVSLRACMQPIVERGCLGCKMHDKPRSRIQRDRMIRAGHAMLQDNNITSPVKS